MWLYGCFLDKETNKPGPLDGMGNVLLLLGDGPGSSGHYRSLGNTVLTSGMVYIGRLLLDSQSPDIAVSVCMYVCAHACVSGGLGAGALVALR